MLPIHYAKHSVFNYDEIPPGYYFEVMQSGPAVQRYWHRRKFEEIARRIPDPSTVLDLGCGPGSFLSVFAETHSRSFGIGADIASGQIEFARARVASRYKDQVQFVEIDANTGRLPIPDRSVDVVTCIEVLEHIHPYYAIQLLSEARRVLKANGRFIATTPNYRSLWPFIEWALEKRSPVKYHAQHINKFTPNSFVKFLETAGFEVKRSGSVMMLSPFFAGISLSLARALDRVEQALFPQLGNLLVLDATAMDLAASVTAERSSGSESEFRSLRELPPTPL